MSPSKGNSLKPAKGKSRKPAAKERRSEILLEDLHGKMTVIAEGHQMLVERMDRMETRLEAKMEDGFQDQNSQRELSNMALTKRIDAVAADVREVRAEVQEVRAEVQGLRHDVQPRLDDHEARLTALEDKPAA